MPVDIVVCISQHLEQLSADSLGLSGAPHSHTGRGQIYEFWCNDG